MPQRSELHLTVSWGAFLRRLKPVGTTSVVNSKVRRRPRRCRPSHFHQFVSAGLGLSRLGRSNESGGVYCWIFTRGRIPLHLTSAPAPPRTRGRTRAISQVHRRWHAAVAPGRLRQPSATKVSPPAGRAQQSRQSSPCDNSMPTLSVPSDRCVRHRATQKVGVSFCFVAPSRSSCFSLVEGNCCPVSRPHLLKV